MEDVLKNFKNSMIISLLILGSLPTTSNACLLFTGGDQQACAAVCPANPSETQSVVCTLSAGI